MTRIGAASVALATKAEALFRSGQNEPCNPALKVSEVSWPAELDYAVKTCSNVLSSIPLTMYALYCRSTGENEISPRQNLMSSNLDIRRRLPGRAEADPYSINQTVSQWRSQALNMSRIP